MASDGYESIADPWIVFSISTACLGGVSVFEYFYRFYNLFRKGSKARPLNARRSWVRLAYKSIQRDKPLTEF
ncbi:hypothetical protein C8Q69DRAFT_472166 [Paecilomyces variotii]|uniref:Uncharacterized protein n=1 Tax=Byssochlamys spectabilis TaxID=264951 RepID=A0A443HQ66_BYSSP|nr:hypothetical protein C8Q69DRAFT_472166 [Paecilomyces variotii]RWQ93965.1 hypothetical protein C8Q69DRAFT_472166 [Paecilomyces variotii]